MRPDRGSVQRIAAPVASAQYASSNFGKRQESAQRAESSIRVYRRTDVACARLTFADHLTQEFAVHRCDLYLLFLIAHFNKATLLSISDELAVAMNRLRVGDTESVKTFKRTIRQSMETFLRFTHRYWFHAVSNQEQARSLFRRLNQQLRNDELYDEVRTEVMDMSNYLDTDSNRRQANTVLRLTVVTIFGLIGTIGTGFLGMNLIAAADASLLRRTTLFLLVLAVTGVITVYTIVKSKRLADLLDALSDDRIDWSAKWRVWKKVW